MSEARERLIEDVAEHMGWIATDPADAALDAFLSRPDDLLAVLIESHGADGVLDALVKAGWLGETCEYGSMAPAYRRTEGNTR